MVALCRDCHGHADNGAYSKDQLRLMKKSNCSADEAKGYFPTWARNENLLVRVGSCYTDTSAPIITVNGIPQLTIRSEGGLLLLSFELRNESDETLVKMEDNWLTAYPSRINDMVVTPGTMKVKVWIGSTDVGLQFSFKRISMEELETRLEQDKDKAEAPAAQARESFLSKLRPESRAYLQKYWEDSQRPEQRALMLKRHEYYRRLYHPRGLASIPEGYREWFLAVDKTGSHVKRWVASNCMMNDGLIPFLDFEQLAIYFHGQRITIKDGISDLIAYSTSFGNVIAAVCLWCSCRSCSSQTR